MENGFDTVSIADLDEATIIGIHPITVEDTRAAIYLADWQAKKGWPTLSTVYTEEYDSYEDLMASIPQHLLIDNGDWPWTVKTTTENTHVIVSMKSGTCQAEDFYFQTVAPLLNKIGLQEDRNYRTYFTDSEKTIAELSDSIILVNAAFGVPQNVILLSGDGGIVEILNVLMRDSPADDFMPPVVSLLPLGTGNALAHSTSLTRDKTFGLRAMMCGSPRPLPVFRAKFSEGARLLTNEGKKAEKIPLTQRSRPMIYGAVVCSWAFHASLVADSDTAQYRQHGSQRFHMAAKENLFPPDQTPPHTYKGVLTLAIERSASATEWKVQEQQEHAYLVATMVSNLEEKLTISPASEPLDGKMRLVHFGPMAGKEVVRLMELGYDGGKHVDDPAVNYQEIEGLTLQFREEDERWRRVCVDGKIVRVEKDGELFLTKERRQALKLRVCPY